MNDVLEQVAHARGDQEFYSPIPEGYTPGKTKFVIVSGTVMSGLGKGIFASSLAKLLQLRGLRVSIMKFDGYLNVDAGTLNPFRHGEVFVLDDGTEGDMDLGTYERFLDLKLSENNYLTGGKLFKRIIDRERAGKYLGRDVQFIPHVTGEIKRFVRNLALSSQADVVFVEVGGTIGDVENSYFIEAMREFTYEEGRENVCHIALTYIIEPGVLGEQKSKAAQLGLRSLQSLGILPDVIACRSEHRVTDKVREKISLAASVPLTRVCSVHDAASVYEVPALLSEQQVDLQVLKVLGLEAQSHDEHGSRQEKRARWATYVEQLKGNGKTLRVALTGKYTQLRDSYASILKALEHAGAFHHVRVEVHWIDTSDLTLEQARAALRDVDGIIVPGAFGSRGAEGKINCLQVAREDKIPYLGLCYGFQMALVEYARNVCGFAGANSTEIDRDTEHPVVDILPEQLEISTLGGNMRLGGHDIEIKEGTLAHELYGSLLARERFRHRWECNPEYIARFEQKGLIFSGRAPGRDIMQILELPRSVHPFYVGTQAHPEFTSRPLDVNPLYRGFVAACLSRLT